MMVLLCAFVQTLQSVNKAVPIVGILSTSYDSCESAYAFANRLVGKYAFHADEMAAACTNPKDATPLLASVHLYFDDAKPCVYLLGIARPESQCFERETTDADVAAFERERFKLQLLLHSCCNLLFVLQESARISTSLLKDVRLLASEKQQVLTQLSPSASSSSSSSKGSKKGNASGGGGSSSTNPFAPGRCVPLVLYVIPGPDEVLKATTAASKASSKTRSATVAYCKAFEAKLATLFRSVRGGAVGSLRMRDVLTSTNLSKERRVFNVDPSHCAVVVSSRSVTEEGRLEARLADLMESIDLSDDGEDDDDVDTLDMDTLLRPLEDDDTGFPRATQYLNRFVDLLLASTGSMAPAVPSSSSGGGGGSKETVRIELLTLAHWLKAWNALVKTMHRMEATRKQDAAAASSTAPASSSGGSGHHQQVYRYDQSDYLQ